MRLEPGWHWPAIPGGRSPVRAGTPPDWWRLLVAICCALALICPDAATAATRDKKRPVKTTAATVKKQPAKAKAKPAAAR